MTEAMPFLQKAILLSYDPRPFGRGAFLIANSLDFRYNEKKRGSTGRPEKLGGWGGVKEERLCLPSYSSRY